MAAPTVSASARSEAAVTDTIAPTLSTHANGDLLILAASFGKANGTAAITISGGSGTWTALFDTVEQGAGGKMSVRWFARIAESASESAPTLTCTGGGAERTWLVDCITVPDGDGVIGNITVGTTNRYNTADVNPPLPTATVSTNESLAIRGAAVSNDRDNCASDTLPTNHVDIQCGDDTLGPKITAATCYNRTSVDTPSIAATTWTSLWASTPNDDEVGVTIVIPPAAGGISIPPYRPRVQYY